MVLCVLAHVLLLNADLRLLAFTTFASLCLAIALKNKPQRLKMLKLVFVPLLLLFICENKLLTSHGGLIIDISRPEFSQTHP